MDRKRKATVGGVKSKDDKKKDAQPQGAAPTLFQFKITLIGTDPPIWRRIQVEDCTLDALHGYIQAAMGWDNSHLHQFVINRKRYGDPNMPLDDFDQLDSTRTQISQIAPNSRKRFAFTYEYDFGDSWEHEVLLEGCPPPEPGKKYPTCLEGERACPPEDIGGVWGYYDLIEALADRKHERHAEFKAWLGPFKPEKFSPAAATKAMRGRPPNWLD